MTSLHFSKVEAALGLFVVFVYILFRFVINKKKKPQPGLGILPPGPRPWPVLGNLHLLGELPHQAVAVLAKKYGPIMFLRLGSVPTVVVSSPAMAKEFLKTHDLLFANRPAISAAKYFGYDSKDVAHAPYGEYWRKIKKLCTVELLTAKRTESFKVVREEEVTTMIRSVWKESEQGLLCVDLSNHLFSLALNIICRMFAGRTYSDHEFSGGHGSFKQMVAEMMTLTGAFVIGDYIPSLNCFDWQGLRRRMQAVQITYDEFAEKLIDEHINRRREKAEEEHLAKDIVDVLLDMAEAESQTTEIKITRVCIKAIILDMLAAGVETSATTIEWAMSELVRNPGVMATAQQEIESVVGRHGFLKESDIASCEYLRCVVKETFRLHPPAPLLVPHESREGCNVAGYYIPPKTRLFVNIWAMGRDESVWEEPYQFKPERFIGKNIDVRGQDFKFLPFGTGRRGCPGTSMGLSVVHLTLAQLLHCFDWSVDSEVNVEEVFGLTAPKKYPLSARPSWRLTRGEAPLVEQVPIVGNEDIQL